MGGAQREVLLSDAISEVRGCYRDHRPPPSRRSRRCPFPKKKNICGSRLAVAMAARWVTYKNFTSGAVKYTFTADTVANNTKHKTVRQLGSCVAACWVAPLDARARLR